MNRTSRRLRTLKLWRELRRFRRHIKYSPRITNYSVLDDRIRQFKRHYFAKGRYLMSFSRICFDFFRYRFLDFL